MAEQTPEERRDALVERIATIIATWDDGSTLADAAHWDTPAAWRGEAGAILDVLAAEGRLIEPGDPQEVERLRGVIAAADEFGDRHVVDFREDVWVLAHPLSCRAAGLFACLFNVAAEDLAGPPEVGKFAVTLDEGGDLVIGEQVHSG